MVPEPPPSVEPHPCRSAPSAPEDTGGADATKIAEVASLLRGGRLAVLTGAGVSTDSGIPDYRSPGRPPRRSIQHQEFVNGEHWRRRYWGRSAVGWPHFCQARPSEVHRCIARLGPMSSGLITQNVDRLHQQAGSSEVIELHGALAEVKCLRCERLFGRAALQERLLEANPTLRAHPADARPDGDAELSEDVIDAFVVVDCEACGGVLMPNVVFFGGSVDKSKVEASYAAVDEADALLVLGTSLTVFSGYRFVRRASDGDKFVVIERDKMIIGCAALENFEPENIAELYCLAVHPSYRETGRGEQIVDHMVELAQRRGIQKVFVLTTQSQHFFRERGFVPATYKVLPKARRERYDFKRRSKVLLLEL